MQDGSSHLVITDTPYANQEEFAKALLGSPNNLPAHLQLFSNVAAGTFIAYSTFPLEAIKKYFQQRDPSVPFKFYRGSLIFAANIVPTTTIQLSLNTIFSWYLNEEMPYPYHLAASAFCGVAGAIPATIVENTIVRQQMMAAGPSMALKDMMQYSLLRPFKSYGQIATRDGVFTSWLFAINPWIKKISQNEFCDENSTYEYKKNVERIAKGCSALIGAGITHPFDTIGTWRQRTHSQMNMLAAAKELYRGATIYLPSQQLSASPVVPAGHGIILNGTQVNFIKDGQVALLPNSQEKVAVDIVLNNEQRNYLAEKQKNNITKISMIGDNTAKGIIKNACDTLKHNEKLKSMYPLSVNSLIYLFKETGGVRRLYAGYPWRFLLFLAFTNWIPKAQEVVNNHLSENSSASLSSMFGLFKFNVKNENQNNQFSLENAEQESNLVSRPFQR